MNYLVEMPDCGPLIRDTVLAQHLCLDGLEGTTQLLEIERNGCHYDLELVTYVTNGEPGAYYQWIEEGCDSVGDVFETISRDPEEVCAMLDRRRAA